MPQLPSWIVTVASGHAGADVAAALAKAGFKVETTLGEIGVITGRCAAQKVAALRQLAGVADIAADQPVDVGPPGSPRTW